MLLRALPPEFALLPGEERVAHGHRQHAGVVEVEPPAENAIAVWKFEYPPIAWPTQMGCFSVFASFAFAEEVLGSAADEVWTR